MLGFLFILGNFVFTKIEVYGFFTMWLIAQFCFVLIYTFLDFLRQKNIKYWILGYFDLILIGVVGSIFLNIWINKEQMIYSYGLLFISTIVDLLIFLKIIKRGFIFRSVISTIIAAIFEGSILIFWVLRMDTEVAILETIKFIIVRLIIAYITASILNKFIRKK